MKAADSAHVRKKIIKELKVAFAIEDHHGQAMWIFWSAHHPREVLRDKVLSRVVLPEPVMPSGATVFRAGNEHL